MEYKIYIDRLQTRILLLYTILIQLSNKN